MVTTLLRRGAPIARRLTRATRRIGPPWLEALETRMLLSAGLQPTSQEQLLLQQLNAIRANPAAYGQSIGLNLSNVAAAQPLAFNTILESTAQAHSQDMNDQNYFGHNSSTGQTPDARMTAAGFNWYAWGESIAAGFPDSASALQGLIVDQGVPDLGHRIQLLALSSLYQVQNQVGVGIVSGSGSYGTYYTIDTAQAAGDSNSFATGVVFNDSNGNGQYAVGEGLGGVTVTANNGASTTTFGSGGYSLELTPGTYTLTFSGGGLNAPVTRGVTIGSQNVEVDVTNPPPSAAPAAISTAAVAQPVATPAPAATAPAAANTPAPTAAAPANQVSTPPASSASALQQQFNFHLDTSGFHQNMVGQNEKWVAGNGSSLWGWYAILPDGSIHTWLGGNSLGAAIGNLGSAVWADPTLLTNAAMAAPPAAASVSSQTTSLSLAPVANITATHGGPVQVTLAATDAPGQTVSYQAQVTGNNSAYGLEQSMNFFYTGDYKQNAVGLNEKWVRSRTSNLANGGWYAILPDGEIRPWTGGNTVGATVATLGASVYADPSLLYSAAAPSVGTSFSGSVLTLSPPGNYVGSLQVNVTASDGTSTASQRFNLTLT
jgi:uncharacterized protein YkwD